MALEAQQAVAMTAEPPSWAKTAPLACLAMRPGLEGEFLSPDLITQFVYHVFLPVNMHEKPELVDEPGPSWSDSRGPRGRAGCPVRATAKQRGKLDYLRILSFSMRAR